jgi:hypothetical protein
MDAVKFPNASNCSLEINTWEQLLDLHSSGKLTLTTGDLGPSRVHHIYLTWICLKGEIPWPARYAAVQYKSSKMAHFVFKCNKEDYLSLLSNNALGLVVLSRPVHMHTVSE